MNKPTPPAAIFDGIKISNRQLGAEAARSDHRIGELQWNGTRWREGTRIGERSEEATGSVYLEEWIAGYLTEADRMIKNIDGEP